MVQIHLRLIEHAIERVYQISKKNILTLLDKNNKFFMYAYAYGTYQRYQTYCNHFIITELRQTMHNWSLHNVLGQKQLIDSIKSGLRRVRNCVGELALCFETVASFYIC